ncbi:MAG TPA: hypothetical protein VN241_09735 [Microbacterium sp.]|nr:hypothetical protein [Microbacterium sp.]
MTRDQSEAYRDAVEEVPDRLPGQVPTPRPEDEHPAASTIDAPRAEVELETPAPPSEPDPSAPKPPRLLDRISPVGKVISGVVAAISFVTGIIAVVPIFTRDATNLDSLRLSATAYGAALEFAIPSTADLAGFPAGAPGSCDPAQQAWLEANGTRISTSMLIDVRNVASDGAMLSLTDFRGTGTSTGEAPLLKVVCDPLGSNSHNLQAARLLVSDPDQVAYFDKSAFGQTQEGIPNSPVAWNLAPGETGQILLTMFPTADFAGGLNLTATSGTESRDVSIPLDDEDRFTLPGLVRGGAAFLQVDGGLVCLEIDGAETVQCDIAGLIGG